MTYTLGKEGMAMLKDHGPISSSSSFQLYRCNYFRLRRDAYMQMPQYGEQKEIYFMKYVHVGIKKLAR